MAAQGAKRTLAGRLLWLTAVGVAFGHLEAVADVYLRRHMGWVPMPADVTIGREAFAGLPGWLTVTEQTRELAALLMLVGIAALVGRILLEKVGVFLYSLGIWGIVHLISVRAMVGWPASLQDTDCLAVLPVQWFGPVWLELLISGIAVVLALIAMVSIERYSAKYGRVGG